MRGRNLLGIWNQLGTHRFLHGGLGRLELHVELYLDGAIEELLGALACRGREAAYHHRTRQRGTAALSVACGQVTHEPSKRDALDAARVVEIVCQLTHHLVRSDDY